MIAAQGDALDGAVERVRLPQQDQPEPTTTNMPAKAQNMVRVEAMAMPNISI
jgi:hypothetical protein